jgi:hypothetical protein
MSQSDSDSCDSHPAHANEVITLCLLIVHNAQLVHFRPIFQEEKNSIDSIGRLIIHLTGLKGTKTRESPRRQQRRI